MATPTPGNPLRQRFVTCCLDDRRRNSVGESTRRESDTCRRTTMGIVSARRKRAIERPDVEHMLREPRGTSVLCDLWQSNERAFGFGILTLGLRPSLTNWLISFLTNRRHRVRYSNTFSDWRNTTCGLPQGTVLGPIIFLALINSAAENAVSMRWKFVDDLNLLECRKVREPPAIQQDLDELSKWSTEQNMKLHPKKCKVMYLNFSKSVPQLPSLKIDNYPLVQDKVAKLLGLHIQSDLKWNTQVDHMVKKGNQRLFFLRRLKTFGVTSDDLVTVYTSFVRPTCEYAVPVWQPGITQTQRLQLKRIQRRAVRTILGAHYTSYTDACHTLGLTTLHQRREHLCETFAKKLLQSTCFREWLPPCRGEISGRKTRNSSHLDTARAINSTRGVHLTVATLSKRCYRMAVGVMNKWAKGTYHRQPTTAVTQTLFYCLVGLEDEQDVFNVLQEFHNGSLKSKKEFDQKVNGIKLSEQGGDACQLLRAEKQRLCETVRNLTEEKTAAEAENQRLYCESFQPGPTGIEPRLLKPRNGQGEDAEKQRLCESDRREDSSRGRKSEAEPHEATEPAPKSSKTLHNWEGKTITMGKMVAVVYSSPRQVYYGRVADIAEREGEQVVMVGFFKKARKSLVANGERQPVPPTFILDTDVQVVKFLKGKMVD
ncbi:hypothetical protein Bbelb_318980 [Branchiostoma belcheri]|nr:hypothetical protein Bbelb_318980 [Branchiostoma belcheri]